MPRYFFDIRSEHAVDDHDGEELADDDAAREVAIRIAGELLPAHARQLALTGRVAIIVRNAQGAVLHELECRLTSRTPTPDAG